MSANRTALPERLKSTWQLLLRLVLDAGLSQWTDETLSTAPRNEVRLRLLASSFLILFLELALIRWVPANVRLMGYFMNFILLAVFLGIGVGTLSGRRAKLWLPPFPLLLFILALVVATSRVELRLVTLDVLYYGGETAVQPERVYLLPVIFILTALTFTPLARTVGRLLTALPPLQAYLFDILGSLAGIAVFFVMSLLSLSPVVWFAIAALAFLVVVRPKEWLLSAPFLLGAVYVVFAAGVGSQWSPYYRMTIARNDKGGYVINVNNSQHQATTHYTDKESFYFRVHDLFPAGSFKNVLVIGAGTGSDVMIALVNGAEHVDAVEIDPLIYKLGLTLHPDHPYDDPRVTVYIEDGRTFLRNAKDQYDLIVYALPDSLTLTSAYSSLRLESFLLTENSIAEASRLLSPDGLVVLYNYYREQWLVAKLAAMVESGAGMTPYVTTYGDTGRAAVIMAGPRLGQIPEKIAHAYREDNLELIPDQGLILPVIGQGFMAGDGGAVLATDDWPFVYMPSRTIPGLYLAGLAMIITIAIILLGLVAPRGALKRFDWHFFFLGAAFMLLETRSLVTFALLFGSTWMVNSLVFFAILSSVLLAILFNTRYKVRRVGPLYVALFGMLALNLIIPQQTLLGVQPAWLKYSLASLLTFLPIFIANVVFSRSFRDTEQADISFGSNLLGSMVGGVCEYMALVSGYQSLLIAVVIFYGLAYWLWRRNPK